MSTQKIFDNIISQFNNDEEEEEEDEDSYNNYKFNKISSILNNDDKPSLRISNKPEENNEEHQENNDNNKFLMSFGENKKSLKDEKDDIKEDNKIYEETNNKNINNNFKEKPSFTNFSFKPGTQKLNHINNENDIDIDNMNINEKKEMEELNRGINYSKRESERIKELMNNNNNDELINNDYDANNDINNIIDIDNDNNNDKNKDNINYNLFTETLNTKIKDSNTNMMLNIENNYNQNNFQFFNNEINRQTFKNNNNNNEINNKNSNDNENINNNNDENNNYINNHDSEEIENDFLNKLEIENKDINENKIQTDYSISLKNENENNNLLINSYNNNNISEKNIYENNKEDNNYFFSELDEENDRIQREKEMETNNSNNTNNIEEQKEEEINKIKEEKEKKKLQLQLELQKNQEKLRQLLMIKKQKDNQLKEVNDNNNINDSFFQKNNNDSIMDNQKIEFIRFKDMKEINYNNDDINKLINFGNENYNTINNKLNSNNFNNISNLNNMNKIHKSFSQDIITSNNISDLVIPAIYNKEKAKNNEINKIIHKRKKINKSPLRAVSTLSTFTLSKKAKTPIKTKNTFNKLKKKSKEENKSPYYKQFRMNKSSYKMLFEYNEKLINNIINKYSDNNKLTIVGIAKCLSELRVFRELLYIKNNKNSKGYNNNDDYLKEINIKKLVYIVECIKKDEKRKNDEMNFLEQIWFILNPYSNKYINNEIFEGFIKLLFSYSNNYNTKKEITLYIKDYLKILYFMGDKNKKIPDEHIYSSPLRNKIFTKEQIWPIEKLVEKFMELKQNLIAYETKRFTQYNNLKKSNNNEENEKQIKKKKKKEKYDFNKLYESYMNKIKIKEQTLSKIRELQEKEKVAMCTDKPKIIKKYNEKSGFIKNSLPVHEKLYRMRNDKSNKILKLKEKYKHNDEKDNSINNLSFRPTKYSKFTKDNIKDLFINNNEKPKGYQSFIKRNLSAIKKKKKDKKEEEDRYTGKNYEKTMKMKFQPPKIKDMEDYEKGGICQKNHFTFPDFINDDNENSDTQDSTIEIKIPNGKIVKLKFDINEDINKKVEEICKIYSLNNNIKQKLIKKMEEIKNYYNQNEN